MMWKCLVSVGSCGFYICDVALREMLSSSYGASSGLVMSCARGIVMFIFFC